MGGPAILGQQIIRTVLKDLNAKGVTIPSRERVLVIEDPFGAQGYDMLMLLRLYARDPALEVDHASADDGRHRVVLQFSGRRLVQADSDSIDQAIAKRKAHQFAGAMEIQLLHDPAAMRLHRVHAELKGVGDFLVGLAFGDHLQHFPLAAGEEIDRICNVLPVIGQYSVGNCRAEISFTAGDSADRRQKVVTRCVLQQIPFRSGAQDLANIDRVLVHAEREHASARGQFSDPARRFDAVKLRHSDVHDDDVGL